MKKEAKLAALLLAVISILLVPNKLSAALDRKSADAKKECHFHTRQGVNPDKREQTSSSLVLPQFLDKKPAHIKKIYLETAKYKQMLSYIPCYCGCGESAGHMNTYQCFIYKDNSDGSIIWDDHASKCGICLDTANTSIIQYREGKSIIEVRKIIEERYKKGFKKPTPTPVPK